MSRNRFRVEDYSVALVCPLSIELSAARLMLDLEHETPDVNTKEDDNTYTCGMISGHAVVIASLPPKQTNPVSAAHLINPMIRTFPNLNVTILVGIGGGIPRQNHAKDSCHDIHLGDVVIGWHENPTQAIVHVDSRNNILPPPDRRILNVLTKLTSNCQLGKRTFAEQLRRCTEHVSHRFRHPGLHMDRLYQSSHRHVSSTVVPCDGCGSSQLVHRSDRETEESQLHFGTIACVNTVVKDSNKRDKIRSEVGAICVEMEAAGILGRKNCLVIRGISDYADSHKHDAWQGYAAASAAAVMREILCIMDPGETPDNLEVSTSYQKAVSLAKEMTSQIVVPGDGINVGPMSPELAWFTNTKAYRSWAGSRGGCLLYRRRQLGPSRRAMLLGQLLPILWAANSPRFAGSDLYYLYFDARLRPGCPFKDFLLSMCCQLLVQLHHDVSAWQKTMSSVEPKTWRQAEKVLMEHPSAGLGPHFDLIDLLMQLAKLATQSGRNPRAFCVLANLHLNSHPEFVDDLLKLKGSFTRIGVHVLIDGYGWRADRLPEIDDDTEYIECLELFKFDDMYTRRDEVADRQQGTNQWIWQHSAFRAWSERLSGVLWIQGKPGSGKSVLAKSIVTWRASSGGLLQASWFYSRRGGPTGISHSSMMKSIAYQLLRQSRSLFDAFAPIHRKSALDKTAFLELLRLCVSDTLCVLDGLDESIHRDTEGKSILELLTHATEHYLSRLRVIVLSRPYDAIRDVYGTYDIRMEDSNREDIQAFLTYKLGSLCSLIDNKRRQVHHTKNPGPELTRSFLANNRDNKQQELANIERYLLDNARGVILWVDLCIKYAIQRAGSGLFTWLDIRRAIEGLPEELDDIYQTALSELPAATDPHELKKARTLLSWIIIAGRHRPLRLKELVDVISITDEMDSTVAARSDTCPLKEQRPVLVSWSGFARDLECLCGPLIECINSSGLSETTHEEDISACSVVQLLHQTVKTFIEEGSEHIFRLSADEAQQRVEQDSYFYLCRVLPLQPTLYTPVLDDVDDDWKQSVKDTLQYLEDKFLLSFILSTNIISLQRYVDAAHDPDRVDWSLRKFFIQVRYWDTNIIETAKKSVVGRCFWLCCTLGMDTAVENLLFLSSLRAGWWEYHREAVLNGAGLAATDHGLDTLRTSLVANGERDTLYIEPALRRNSWTDSSSQILWRKSRQSLTTGYSSSSRRRSFHPSMGFKRIDSSPPPRNTVDRRVVAITICRILHYLEGHSQPLDMAMVSRFKHTPGCRCFTMLQDSGFSL